MNKEQMDTVVGLLSGMQTAVVHLSNVLCVHTGVSPDDLATSFEETGEAIPADVKNRQLLQLVLRQVAAGIRGSAAGEEWERLVASASSSPTRRNQAGGSTVGTTREERLVISSRLLDGMGADFLRATQISPIDVRAQLLARNGASGGPFDRRAVLRGHVSPAQPVVHNLLRHIDGASQSCLAPHLLNRAFQCIHGAGLSTRGDCMSTGDVRLAKHLL